MVSIKNAIKFFFKAVKFLFVWSLIIAVSLEAASFVILHGAHYFIYGRLRDYNNVYYDPYTIYNNRGGIRPTIGNVVAERPEDNRTIWMFGGSTMRGYNENDEGTIPSVMAADLNAGPGPIRFTLNNYGEPAFNSIQEVKYLQKEMIEDPQWPDMIVFYDGINDCIFFSQYRDPNSHYGMRRMRALIENYHNSFFGLFKGINAYIHASFTKELYDKTNQMAVDLESDSPELAQYIDNLEMRYDYIDRICRASGIQFVLVWQPMAWVQDCPPEENLLDALLSSAAAATSMRHNYSLIYRLVIDRLADKPYFLDYSQALCGQAVPVYQPDGIHLNDDGRRIMAGRLAEIVRDRLDLQP